MSNDQLGRQPGANDEQRPTKVQYRERACSDIVVACRRCIRVDADKLTRLDVQKSGSVWRLRSIDKRKMAENQIEVVWKSIMQQQEVRSSLSNMREGK